MDRLMTPEIPINVLSRYISYPASSNPLSSLPSSELPDTIPRIEEEIKNYINEDGSDGEIKINDKIKDTNIYNRPKDKKI